MLVSPEIVYIQDYTQICSGMYQKHQNYPVKNLSCGKRIIGTMRLKLYTKYKRDTTWVVALAMISSISIISAAIQTNIYTPAIEKDDGPWCVLRSFNSLHCFCRCWPNLNQLWALTFLSHFTVFTLFLWDKTFKGRDNRNHLPLSVAGTGWFKRPVNYRNNLFLDFWCLKRTEANLSVKLSN